MPEREEYESRDRFGGLRERDYDDVLNALREWAETHPQGKEPVFFEMGKSLSPFQFTIEVAERTDIGRSFLKYIAIQSERTDTRPRTFIDRAIVANRGE